MPVWAHQRDSGVKRLLDKERAVPCIPNAGPIRCDPSQQRTAYCTDSRKYCPSEAVQLPGAQRVKESNGRHPACCFAGLDVAFRYSRVIHAADSVTAARLQVQLKLKRIIRSTSAGGALWPSWHHEHPSIIRIRSAQQPLQSHNGHVALSLH